MANAPTHIVNKLLNRGTAKLVVIYKSDTEKYSAKVIAKGQECDLALLHVEDPNFWKDTKSLEFGGIPELHEPVVVLGYPSGGTNLSLTAGVVSRLDIRPYAHSNIDLLCLQIDAAINPGNSGGPALNTDLNVAGVSFQAYEDAQNIGYIIPSPVIQRFLMDVNKNNKFTGLAFLNCKYQHLSNKALKDYLKIHEIDVSKLPSHITPTGIYITDVPEQNIGLKKGDVVLAIDNVDIGSDGTIYFRNQERVDASYLTLNYFTNDLVDALVWRDKNLLKVPIKLLQKQSIVPYHQWDINPRYFVYGGLVFCPFSVEWLRDQYGENFSQNAPYSILKYIGSDQFPTTATEEIVVLSQILPTELSKGYDMGGMRLKKVNDIPVTSLKFLIECINKTRDKEFCKFEFENNSVIILNNKEVRNSFEDIKNIYRIQHLWSSDFNNSASKIFN